MQTPTLCALGNGGVTLVEMNPVEIRQRYGKAVICLCLPPAQRSGEESGGKGYRLSSLPSQHHLLIHSVRPVGRLPAAENPVEKQDRPLGKEAQWLKLEMPGQIKANCPHGITQ